MLNLTIIGTSHIAAQSIKEIKKAIAEGNPELVAVELDLARATSLFQEERKGLSITAIRQLGVKGYLFAKIGQLVQQKLGKMVGVAPGTEMKTALELARKQKIRVAFIDQPIQITLRRFSQSITWREKGRFVGDIMKGVFFPKQQLRELGLAEFDLQTVPAPEVVAIMIKNLQKRYPSVYRTLVEERNKYMVRQLVRLLREYPGQKILVIVGAGHVEGMQELLRKVEVVR